MPGAGQDTGTDLHGVNEMVMLTFSEKSQLSIFQMLFSDQWKSHEQLGYVDIYSHTHTYMLNSSTYLVPDKNTSVDIGWINGSIKIGHQ